MGFDQSLLSDAFSLGIPEKYYDLCEKFPLADTFVKKVPNKEVLNAAVGQIGISKLPGPGTAFQLCGLPSAISVDFIIQSGGTVETAFCLTLNDLTVRGTFAIFCKESTKNQGLPTPNPPYPRPICKSAQEMISAFKGFHELALLLAKAASEACIRNARSSPSSIRT